MPLPSMKDTATVKQIAEALGVTERSIQRRAEREQWPHERRPGRGGGKAYHVASLPEPVRIALARQISRPALGIIQGGKAPSTVSAPVSPSPLAVAPPDPALPPAALGKAALKADLVRAYLDAKAWGRKHGKPLAKCREAFALGYNSGQICPTIREQLGPTSWQSLERWAVGLRRADYDCAAIAPRYGLHRKGACKVTAAEEERLLALLLSQSQFKIGTAITLMKMDLERQGISSPSSPSTLRNWVEAFRREHADVWTLAREGEKALTDKIAPFLRRDAGLLTVGDVLIADGHRLNFRVRHPLHGRPCRATLVAFEDWASRDIAGFSIMLEEDLCAVHLALYRSIIRLGKLPRVVMPDNGKAFKNKVFVESKIDLTTSGMAGLYGRLGIMCHFPKAYSARSKPIESFFKTAGLSFEKAVSSYCGGSIAAKPARMRRNEKFMQEIEPEALLSMDEASGLFESWLNSFYRIKPHSGLGGKCPGEVFAAGRGQGLDHASIRYLMMHEEVANLHNNGIKRFGGEYFDEALYGLRDKVLIRYDWHDLRQVFVYRLDGSYLCMAKRQGAVHPMFKLIGGKDAEGYSDFKATLATHESLKKSTKKTVRKLAKAGLIAEARDILPVAELAETGSPRLPESLEAIEAAHTPDEPDIPDFSEPTPPVPTGPGPLIDPTNLDYFSTEELGAELAYQQQRAKTGR
jgi:putative transposase